MANEPSAEALGYFPSSLRDLGQGHGDRIQAVPVGPRYQWTRVEKGKTITVALSAEQYE